jgi:predicted PhzF superfamily epimerase YddE/YHI9
MKALQLSRRGGTLFCRLRDNRVDIGGKAVTYLKGEISL